MITPSFGLTATERVLPKLALDFTTASLDSRITFTRTTGASNPATFVNSSGYVAAATNNQPRFDYDPVTLACKGLLIEESRTNLYPYSKDFSNANWLKTNLSVTANVVLAPDESTTGDKLVENTATATRYILTSTNMVVGTAYAVSVFAKAAERNQLFVNEAGTNQAVFDVAAGTVVSTSGCTATITAFPNGWFKCTWSKTAAYAAPPRIGIVVAGGTYTGDGTSGLYIWGAQLEAGAFATSYIPTTTAALTRNADVAVMTGTNFSDWFNASEGTIFSEASSQGTFVPAFITDGTDAKSISTRSRAAGVSNTAASVADVTEQLSSTFFTFAATNKVALGFKANDFAWSVNGATPATDNSGSLPAVNRMNFGSLYAFSFSGLLKKVLFYPQRLTNSEIQAITK